jgi:hypothetical protein
MEPLVSARDIGRSAPTLPVVKLAEEKRESFLEPESDLIGKFTFEPVNEVTWKLTDGVGTNAWRGDRGGSYAPPGQSRGLWG